MRLKYFTKLILTDRNFLIKSNSQGEQQDSTTYLKEYITAFNKYLVHSVPDRDLVGLRIRNSQDVQDKVVGISYVLVTRLRLT
jgi:hypothetical protein